MVLIKDIKENIRKKLLNAYFPKPEIINLWYEADLGVFYAITKLQIEKNAFYYLSTWDQDYEKCTNEIDLTEKSLKALYKIIKSD